MKKPVEKKSRRIHQSSRRGAAEQGNQSNTRLREPHLDFPIRSHGSLPETITASDLASLNSSLASLFARLREARQQYDKEEDGARVAAFTALGAMWQFIALFNSPLQEQLHVPILKLMDALAALDHNNVLPILKPVTRTGRAPSSTAYSSLQGHAAGAVMRLRMLGIDPTQACALVAKELTKLGIKPDRGVGGITGNTIRHWCDHVASDVARHGPAAFMYDMMFMEEAVQRFRALPPAEAPALALASLRQYIQTIFPELRIGADKPS